jgi:Cft2 family RNA processing exonuclease
MGELSSSHSEGQGSLFCYPYAVGHQGEGVCFLLQLGEHRLLLDCGLADVKELTSSDRNFPPIDLILCSHAHPDHARGLLALHRAFPDVPIYASEVTVQLLPLNWLEETDVPSLAHALPTRSRIALAEDLTVELYPAGHLPGACAIALTYTNSQRCHRLLYTGDFFLSNSRLAEGLSIEELRNFSPDILIIEGSYGTARHPHRRQQENQLMARLSETLAAGQNIVLPVPYFGLAQEMLVLLRSHHQFTGRDLDIWIDPTISEACEAYLDILPHLPDSVQNFAKHQPLFWDDRVRPRVRPLTTSSDINQGSTILLVEENSDWQHLLSQNNPQWVIFLPERPTPQQMTPATLPWHTETYLLAQHSDGLGTTQLIHNLRPQHVIFIHGPRNYLLDLTSLEELQNRYHLHLPRAKKQVELHIGDQFLQPAAPPETSYEGEVTEEEKVINIQLPSSIVNDPRWHNFSDTGLVKARWQGEELVLRGLSQKEILSQTSDEKLPRERASCGNCRHRQRQHCRNPASPLYGFQVTPDGYCPVFEPLPENSDDEQV